jgi:carbonyl reductase 1
MRIVSRFTSVILTSLCLFLQTSALTSEMMRVAVVTGANKGIGKAIASNLATSGIFTHVILGCRDNALAIPAVKEISDAKNACNVSSFQLTIGDNESHASFCKAIEEKFGKVDVLVNNAGMAFKSADPTSFEDQCKPTLDVNFRGTVDFTEHILPLVRKGSDARIVNVASMAGKLIQLRSKELQNAFSSPVLAKNELYELVNKYEVSVKRASFANAGEHAERGWGNSNYGFSKLALIAMTKVWAREEAKNGISVNCCCPGYCDTDMTSHRGSRSATDGAKNAVIPATMENPPKGEYFSDYKVATW